MMAEGEVKLVGVGLEEEEKWVKYYSSNHQILLVGEGDFSFSLCLAQSFGSASNIVASSLDTHGDVMKKYKKAMSNLDNLQKLGASVLHGVDATKMKLHPDLKMRRFDRVIFNFPHAGFHGREDSLSLIKKHKILVRGFFMNASCMLRPSGEIHVNHKTTAPFSNWNIERLAMQSLLTLVRCADFKKEDYPGYDNKRGHSLRCDEPFPLGKCSTFIFVRAREKPKIRNRIMGSMKQRNLPFQVPTSFDLNYYPRRSHIPILGSYSNSVACYSVHGINSDLQRSWQPLQPWPTLINVRNMDMIPFPLAARNEPFQVFGRNSSSYLAEALGNTAQNASFSFQRVRPEFERYIVEVPGRTLNGEIYIQRELHRRGRVFGG